MIIYLEAYEIPEAGATFGRHSGREVRHIILPEGTAPHQIGEIVSRSFSESESSSLSGTVDLLVINSHGSPGRLHLGGVTDSENDIDIHNYERLTSVFRPLLKPRDQGGEGVEIHACQVAAGSLIDGCGHDECGSIEPEEIADPEFGFRFVFALACGFNNRVRASVNSQVADIDGLIEGVVVEARPDDDVDFHGHVVQLVDPRLSHSADSVQWYERYVVGIPGYAHRLIGEDFRSLPRAPAETGRRMADPRIRRPLW